MKPSDRFRDDMCYEAGPVTDTPAGPHITSMEDVRAALTDPRFSHATNLWLPAGVPHSMALNGTWGTEGEQHRLRRRLLRVLLSLQTATAMTSKFDKLTIAEIRAISQAGDEFNFADLAYGVTFKAVLAMIGFPPDSVGLLEHLRAYERYASLGVLQPEAPQVREYFVERLGERQAAQVHRGVDERPRDLLEVLADALTREVVTLEDACGDIMMFLAAAMGTTGTVVGNTFGLVHENPAFVAALHVGIRDAQLVDKLVSEALRFKTAFSHGPTNVLERLVLPSGTPLGPGFATLCFSAANRDERVFDSPHTYAPTRPNLDDSIGFGFGRHLCPGRHHGQLAARRIVVVTHRYMAGLRLDPSGEWTNKAGITDVVENAPALHDSRATLAGLPPKE